ncbi:MAG: phosphate ABC transporter substrate-binding protein [Bacteroidota bacterium]|nr:phosphate ABC transporter substrate-binding protein [Bacteroidota bacterium]
MKKLLFVALASVAMFNATMAQSFKIKGSDTCLPLIQKESEVYMKGHKGTSITVVGGGSGVGIAALLSGSTDVAMASRKMKMDEKLKMQDAGRAVKEVVFANDAIAFIVNPANKVSQLTREQLEGIFTGKIKNWNQVGGDNMPIVVYCRESSSGTYEFVKERILLNKNFASNALLMPATGAIVQSVSQTKGAIGYVGLAYVEKSVKAIGVSNNKGKSFVHPSLETAMNKTYPVTRPLQLYYQIKDEKKVSAYIAYLLSAEGQKTVKAEGYVPLK